MKTFKVAETKSTPLLHFDLALGILDIKGISIPEHPREFYKPLYDAITEYKKDARKITTINFSLMYFNSSSSRSILQMIGLLKEAVPIGGKLAVNWYYDKIDEDQLETAKDIEALAALQFNYIAI